MFLKVLKKINAKKFLKKHFSDRKEIRVEEVGKVASVACIVDIDTFKNVKALYAIAESLNVKTDEFHLIVYTDTPEKHPESTYPLFLFKDIHWKLYAKSGDVKAFLDREYDMLINYFTEEKLPLLLLSALTKAKIRVGFRKLNENYNDILFKIPMHNHNLFKNELIKYLHALKKI